MTDMPVESFRRRIGRSVGVFVAALLLFYSFPLPGQSFPVLELLAFLAGIAALIVLVVWQARRQLAAPDSEAVRLSSLLVVLYIVIMFFALAYVWIEQSSPGQFSDLQTRTDALYFTVATLGTVGYGDVHPVGQAARAVATTQIVFDLVFVAALVSVFSGRASRVLAAHRAAGGD
jgi:voltage-gated potassium channel